MKDINPSPSSLVNICEIVSVSVQCGTYFSQFTLDLLFFVKVSYGEMIGCDNMEVTIQ